MLADNTSTQDLPAWTSSLNYSLSSFPCPLWPHSPTSFPFSLYPVFSSSVNSEFLFTLSFMKTQQKSISKENLRPVVCFSGFRDDWFAVAESCVENICEYIVGIAEEEYSSRIFNLSQRMAKRDGNDGLDTLISCIVRF